MRERKMREREVKREGDEEGGMEMRERDRKVGREGEEGEKGDGFSLMQKNSALLYIAQCNDIDLGDIPLTGFISDF